MESVAPGIANGSSADEADEKEWRAEMLMRFQVMRGGRELEKLGGGTLYEVASRYDDEEAERRKQAARRAFFELGGAPGWRVKSSVERKRTRVAKALEHDFLCEGTMFRHTAKSWKDAPRQLQPPHEVQVTDSAPADVLVREHLIEDLTPFSRDVYWIPVWRKCKACQESDAAFRTWVAEAQATSSDADASR